jgi:DNA-binding response OmpR family regulator
VLSDPLAVTGIFMLGAGSGALITYIRQKHVLSELSELLNVALPRSQKTAPATGFAMKALVVASDAELISTFAQGFRERHIAVEECGPDTAVEQLSSEKISALVLDLDQLPECAGILNNIRGPNRRILVIGIATGSANREIALSAGASLIIERPVDCGRVRDLLASGYGRMLRDSQSYFRLAVELPVSIRRETGPLLQCTTLNLSQTGMAVHTPAMFTAGEAIRLAFAIPNTDVFVSAEGKVIWDDKHGKAGINFECTSAAINARFCEWLHDHFYMKFGSDVRDLDSPRQIAYAG